MKRGTRTPAKQLGLCGFADDKIIVPWARPQLLFEVPQLVKPEAVERAAEVWKLNDGQREVLKAFCLEKMASNGEIASHLGYKRRTVEKHFEFLFASAGVRSRAALVLEVADFEPRPEPARADSGLRRVEDSA